MKNKSAVAIAAIFVLIAGGAYFFGQNGGKIAEREKKIEIGGFGAGQKAVVYKSPACGCCEGYAEELEKRGFEVEVVTVEDMDAVKGKYGIAPDKQSCHTIAMGKYFIEGHVPMEAVEKLLKEKPDIDGIGLPRMPSGTPGMAGPKRAPYEVYMLKDGAFGKFLTI